MKGKLKFSLKIILTAAISLFAGVCFVGLQPAINAKKELPAHAVAILDGKEYSAKLDGDVVLSVEKVAVDENGNYSGPITGSNVETFYLRDGSSEKEIHFQNINQDGKSKQVVEDGQFVMLNNKNIGGVYKNPTIDQAESIIISLGQYVYFNEKISNTQATAVGADTAYAQMTYLNVKLTHNGKEISDLRYRNIDTTDGSRFYDFMYMITEDASKNIEGHYILEVEYIKGGVEYSSDFDFFLVCESTYTRTKIEGGQTYTSAPQLGWSENCEFEEKSPTDGFVHYYEGISGINIPTDNNKTTTISYPTITYDYTKYQMSYTLTANRSITTYSLNYVVKANGEAEMVCSIDGLDADEKRTELTNYDKEFKLVTVVFTEQGNYNFSFKYLYTGADSANAPTMDRLKIDNKQLSIHGVDLNYSKQEYTGAQFRKFNFAANDSSEVCLIIPNGYEQDSNIDKYKNKALQTMYTLNKDDLLVDTNRSVRVGEVIVSNEKEIVNVNGKNEEKYKLDTNGNRTEDTLQNIKFNLTNETTNDEISNFVKNVLDTSKYTSSPNGFINSVIELSDYRFEFVKTNQGSMWLSYADKILESQEGSNITSAYDRSFYFHSRNAFTEDSFVTKNTAGTAITGSTALAYNNQTSFNKVGYYLVFVKVDPNGDTDSESEITDDFWQVYAFQYMSDTIDIDVKTEKGLDVGAGKYTKENVTISWKDPETFETKIVGKYYRIINKNASRDELLKTADSTLVKDSTNKSQVLGGDVQTGQFAKYLIKLERAGKSATYKMFTIDRQPISGVSAYAIKTRGSTGSVFYEFATKSGNLISIDNGITNSYATLSWNKKGSGAQITATYSYTPFVKDTTAKAEFVNGKWITTNYKLGTTINNCELAEVESRANVGYDSVLMGQGIYVFTLIDEAENATKYMLVIDNTEAYIQVNDGKNTEILPNESYRLYGDDVTYTTGSHKAISLDFVSGDTNEIENILSHVLDNNQSLTTYSKDGIKFYTGDSGLNANSMRNLFQKFSTDKYLTVENQKVVAYVNASKKDEYSALTKPPIGTIIFDRDKLQGATSLYTTLYVVGANMLYSASYNDNSPNKSISYVSVEINTDNARGMAYYGNTAFDIDRVPENGQSSSSVKKLETGSDVYNEDGSVKISGIGTLEAGAHATKDRYVAFTWLVGEDKFTVKTLKYQYYELNLNGGFDKDKFFYTANGGEKVLFDSVSKDDSIVIKNGRAFFMINTEYDGTTKAGLYKFTRYYKYDPNKVEDYVNGKPVDYGDDTYSLTYYFIVDRNGIHDVTNEIGKYIAVELLEDETKIPEDDFSLVSTKPKEFKYDGEDFDTDPEIIEPYYIYFQTNRVPAVLRIPTGKYFNGTNSSYKYYSGQLKVGVYFQDIYNQIDSNSNPYKIFEKVIPNDKNYYDINIYEYLKTYESGLVDKMIANTKDGKSWLHLQGRYIIFIEDNVKASSTAQLNKKIIGFDIIEEIYPEVDIKTGGTDVSNEMTKEIAANKGEGKFEVTTNQEFIRVELPLCNKDSYMAQIDNQYILVKQNFNNQGEKKYIEVIYDENKVGKLETDETTGKRYVKLSTLLREDDKKDGRILTENFNKPLYYTITVRYQIGDVSNQDIYKDCYVYYNSNGEKKYFYESTYKITIDRLAPTANVENLRQADKLIQEGYIDAEFEADYYEESKMYFTYQYADYYNNGKKLSDIYAFRVTDETIYDKTDVVSLYVSSNAYSKDDLRALTLNLPIVSFGGYTLVDLTSVSNYGNIGFSAGEGYYQILELDAAGNMTQYVVYYSNSAQEYLSMPITYTPVDPSLLPTGAEKVNVDNIGSPTSPTRIELYDILANGEVQNSGDYFFHVALKDVNNINNDNWQPLDFVTNFASIYAGDNSISNEIVKAIGSRKGNYELTITSRAGQSYKLGISVYSESDKIELDIEKLIQIQNGKYYINLRGANITKGNNVFYAKQITVIEKIDGEEAVEKTYTCRPGDNYNYYDELDNKINGAIIPCSENATYKITLIDVFGDPKTTRFNTTGKEFYSLTYSDFGNYFINEEGHFYLYSDMEIEFDGIFELNNNDVSITLDNNTQIPTIYVVSENHRQFKVDETLILEIKDHKVYIYKVFNSGSGKGSILNVVLQFKETDGTEDRTFNITIDTTTAPVTLKDFTTGDMKNLKLYNNIDISTDIQDLKNYKPADVTSGIMNLSWTRESKENYDYSYQLFELKKLDEENSEVVEIDIKDVSNAVIDTKEDSRGVYWFVINILSPDGELLGNKVYAFEVQAVNSNLYYVKNEDGLALTPNSLFKKGEIDESGFTGDEFQGELPGTNIPLYVTNQTLELVLTENVTSKMRTKTLANEQKFILYEIDATTYQLYFGILQIEKTDKLVNKENISGEVEIGELEFVTLVGDQNKQYTFNAERTQLISDIFAKNTLLLDIEYDGQKVKTIEFNEKYIKENGINISYDILGNGSYTFKLRDLAGNEHVYENKSNSVETLILREVVVTINDQVPVENAYYNGEVSLKVYAATKYVTGSISVSAYRNGKPYTLASSNPYIFKDYGTYVVTINAQYKDASGAVHNLSKHLTFSIINANEVRTSIDLTNLRQHKITKVLNPKGIDITEEFLHMMNNKSNAMLIKHEEIMQNSQDLQISAGKLLFTIEYLVSDGIYPDRTLQVQFTLNDETPVINCSLDVGESTKKEFSISFNPGIIFEQIGESYIYINDEVAYAINSASPTAVVELKYSFKKDGAGDYYIKLEGTSGYVWQSFKVEIKEPLNAGAIIIIVVVVAVVGTVVTTIIILRRKMRIR